jgi:DNA-binding XRE family transcriptional regulator
MRRSRFEGNKQFYTAVGRRIALARAGRLTHEALAQEAALTRTAIVNIEKGRQQILLHTVVEIARALAIPVTALLPEKVPSNMRNPGKTLATSRRHGASGSAHHV